jgi:hypothetical protein
VRLSRGRLEAVAQKFVLNWKGAMTQSDRLAFSSLYGVGRE